MCASVFPVVSQKHRRCFCRNCSSDMCCWTHVLKRIVDTVAVSDKDPLIRGASFECPPNPPRKGDSPRQVTSVGDISWGDTGIAHPCKKKGPVR